MEPDLQTPRVIREKLLAPETEDARLYLQLEKLEVDTAREVPRAAVVSDLVLYLFTEDSAYFLLEPQLTAAEKRTGRPDGCNLLREDAKFRWDALLEVDFIAGDQSVMALRFTAGMVHLRFGDDFGLSLFKRELRRLLPRGVEHWRREFGSILAGDNVEDGVSLEVETGAGDEETGACSDSGGSSVPG